MTRIIWHLTDEDSDSDGDVSDNVILIEVGKSSDDDESDSENGRCYSLATPELGGHVQCIWPVIAMEILTDTIKR